jgi:hypothetical protein
MHYDSRMYKLKRWRTHILFFVLLSLSSLFVGVLSNPTKAEAATQDVPNLLLHDATYKDLSAHQHYWWLYACFRSTDIDNISKEEMNNWDIFEGEAASQHLGDMYDGEGGHRSCESQEIVKTAFGYLGATDPATAFCSLAKTFWDSDKDYYDDATCRTSPGSGTWDMDGSLSEQAATFKDKFESKKPPLTSQGEYLRAYSSLMQGCDITLSSETYDSSKDVPGADDGNGNRYAVPVIIETGAGTFEVKYKLGIGLSGDNKRVLVATSASYGVQEKTCNELVNIARDNAQAYATILARDGYDSDTGDDQPTGTTEPVCSAGALGWVFCPLTDFISDATVNIAEIIESQLIYTSLLGSDQGNATRAIWGVVLGIANIGLAISFLVIIFSQATSIGLSTYGIKKILPRVVAVAILMNLSFFICAAAVDIANILGVSIKEIVSSGMTIIDNADPAADVQNGASGAQNWSAAIIGILGLGLAVSTGAIFLLLPLVLTALFAVLTALLVIAARQVLITLLIIVAPLAFLAWVLPNTEQWFTKWRKLFTAMLLMYPLVMIIFYGSLLMSKLILVTTEGGTDGDPRVMTNVIALAVLTVPLFSLPFIMKSAGGVLDRLGVMVNNRNKGLIDRSRKWANDNGYRKFKQQEKAERKARISSGSYVGAGGVANPRNMRSRLNRRLNTSQGFNTATGGFGAQRDLARQAQERKDTKDAIDMFGGDYDLASAWTQTRGDSRAASTWTNAAGERLSQAQLQQFGRMRDAGHHHKATSHLAAAQFLSENGQADGATVFQALQNAQASGATATDVASASESAAAAYRGSGRGDAFADLRTRIDRSRNPAAAATTAEQGWSQVAASSAHRNGVGDPSYANFLMAGAGNKTGEIATIEALRGFDRMEARAQNGALPSIIAAANAHATAAGYAGPAFTTVQEAKTHFGITT